MADFGQHVMNWGSGDADADNRIQTLTASELISAGITAEIAEKWHQFYLDVAAENPNNPSAKGRARLMAHARKLLEKRSRP